MGARRTIYKCTSTHSHTHEHVHTHARTRAVQIHINTHAHARTHVSVGNDGPSQKIVSTNHNLSEGEPNRLTQLTIPSLNKYRHDSKKQQKQSRPWQNSRRASGWCRRDILTFSHFWIVPYMHKIMLHLL